MTASALLIMDFIGTIAFALSGAIVAIHRRMDLFGVNILAIVTAVGGGITRDILIGHTPPNALRDPSYVLVALITGNVVFAYCYFRKKRVSSGVALVYEEFLFWCDTLGLAAFTIDGAAIGLTKVLDYNFFFPVFLGVLTGVGGGVLRDVFSAQLPSIFVKQIYAVASLVGACAYCSLREYVGDPIAAAIGFGVVVLIRLAAKHYKLDLPKVHQ